jgi:hypothetical protein
MNKRSEFTSSPAQVHMVLAMMEHGQVDQPDQIDHLGKLDPRRVAVVLVDFQNDFCRPARPDLGRVHALPEGDGHALGELLRLTSAMQTRRRYRLPAAAPASSGLGRLAACIRCHREEPPAGMAENRRIVLTGGAA